MVALDLNIRGGTTSHGKYGHILVYKFLVTGNVKTFEGDFDKDTADAATLGMDVEDNLPGIAKGMWKCDGVMSTPMERRMLPLKNRQSAFQCGSFPKGLSAGAPGDCMPASFGKYSKSFSKKDETGIKFELGARGAYNEGVVSISPKTYLTGASGVGPVDDNSVYQGATSYGGAVYAWLHVPRRGHRVGELALHRQAPAEDHGAGCSHVAPDPGRDGHLPAAGSGRVHRRRGSAASHRDVPR